MKNFYTFVKQFFLCIRDVWVVIAVLFSLIMFGAVVISVVEQMPLSRAVYFALITGMTIGYGDVTPETVAGKVVSLFIGLIGIVLFGVIIGISTRSIVYTMHPNESEKLEKENSK